MIKGVIFDSDGVLVETDEYHYLAWKTIADEEGIDFDRTINNQLRGVSRADSLAMILKRSKKEYTEEEKKALADKKNGIYLNYIKKLSPENLNAHVKETLTGLKEKGIKVAVGSSSVSTALVLEKLGIKDMFDAIVTGNDTSHAKPEPDIFLLASTKLNLKPEECLIVEDGVSGIQAGKNAGFVTSGIKEASEYYQTDYPLKDIGEVLPLVEKLNK